MARDGSGTMTIPNPDFVAGTTIESAKVDANNTDIVNELTNSIAADGQTTPTANLKMGGFKLTGMGVGTAATDSAHLGQVQAQAYIWCGTATGTADAIALSPSPAITAYAAGQAFRFISSGNNTTAVTVAVSGLTTKAVQNGGQALEADDIVSGQMYEAVYDGTQFQINSLIALRGLPRDLELISADAGANFGPQLSLYRNSASPAVGDSLGEVVFNGEDSLGNKEVYGRIYGRIHDPTSGSEDGSINFFTVVAGTLALRFRLGGGLYHHSITDQGDGTINATTLYENNTALSAIYEVIDADILRADVGDTLTAGYLSDSYSGGTVASGTYTPAPATGQENFQHIINAGAFTLAPPASPCTVVLEITNHATTAGAITTSGFTIVTGDTVTTTGGEKFIFQITKTQTYSHLNVVALQ